MLKTLAIFERWVIIVLIVLLAATIVISLFELSLLLVQEFASEPLFFLKIEELLDVFGLFLLVILGIELLETLKAYLRTDVVHIEVVMVVGLIALSRKVIILDLKETESFTLAGLALLIAALSWGFVVIRRCLGEDGSRGTCGPAGRKRTGARSMPGSESAGGGGAGAAERSAEPGGESG